MQLDVYDGDVRIDTLTLTNDTTCLGRALDVDIRIEHASTSRKHCEIIRDPGSGAYLLVDLKSSQGTHLNGARIPPNEPQKLLDGHHIRLGASARTYKVIIDDGAAAAAAAAQAAAAAASDRESEDRARYERERYERQRADDERYERERADRERYERERYDVDERERGERERDERERVERDERDRYERERADRERYERERAERERMDSMIRDRPSEASAPLVRKNSYGGSVAPGGSSYSNGGSVPKLNMNSVPAATKLGASGEVVHDEGPSNAQKVFASPRSTTPFKKGAVHAVREQIEHKLESERTARDSSRESLRGNSPMMGRDSIRGSSPIRGGTMGSSAPPPPVSYVPSYERNGSGSFSSSGKGNGVSNGVSSLSYKQQDAISAICHMLDDAKLNSVEKAQVLTAVQGRVGMR